MGTSIASGENTPTPDPVQPVNGGSGIAQPTPIADRPSGPTMAGLDTTAMNLEQQHQGAASIQAAQAAGMSAESGRRDHYGAQVGQHGGQAGDNLTLPLVPAAAVPPAMSDDYPYSGQEPTPAAAGMAGPYGVGQPH